MLVRLKRSDKSIGEIYQEIRKKLADELLNHIKSNSADFFEELVIDLLVAMGYGGSREDAQAVGRSGDGGIDGIINEDRLGLDVSLRSSKTMGRKCWSSLTSSRGLWGHYKESVHVKEFSSRHRSSLNSAKEHVHISD